jgi:hypothetical protein
VDARRNSERPEQDRWWAETAKLFDGAATRLGAHITFTGVIERATWAGGAHAWAGGAQRQHADDAR